MRSGNPVVYGTEIGANWKLYQAGEILENTKTVTGRHATVLLGIQENLFIGENSWGNNWGDDGFYLLDPEVVASDAAKDFWVIQTGWE